MKQSRYKRKRHYGKGAKNLIRPTLNKGRIFVGEGLLNFKNLKKFVGKGLLKKKPIKKKEKSLRKRYFCTTFIRFSRS